MGRQTALSEREIIALCANIELRRLSVAQAATQSGLSRRTISDYRRKYAEKVSSLVAKSRLTTNPTNEEFAAAVALNTDSDLVRQLRAENAELRTENERLRSALIDPDASEFLRLREENQKLRDAAIDLLVQLQALRDRHRK